MLVPMLPVKGAADERDLAPGRTWQRATFGCSPGMQVPWPGVGADEFAVDCCDSPVGVEASSDS